MGHWPSYNCLDKRARAAYLTWLIEGRRNESAYIGYVFLFFYGLERRLLVDHGSVLNHPEVGILVNEIEGPSRHVRPQPLVLGVRRQPARIRRRVAVG